MTFVRDWSHSFLPHLTPLATFSSLKLSPWHDCLLFLLSDFSSSVCFLTLSLTAYSLHLVVPGDLNLLAPLSGDWQCQICIFSQNFLLSFKATDKMITHPDLEGPWASHHHLGTTIHPGAQVTKLAVIPLSSCLSRITRTSYM